MTVYNGYMGVGQNVDHQSTKLDFTFPASASPWPYPARWTSSCTRWTDRCVLCRLQAVSGFDINRLYVECLNLPELRKLHALVPQYIEPQMDGPLMTLSTFGRSKTLSRLAYNWRQKKMLKSNSIVPELHNWLNITHSHTISHIHHTYHCNS